MSTQPRKLFEWKGTVEEGKAAGVVVVWLVIGGLLGSKVGGLPGSLTRGLAVGVAYWMLYRFAWLRGHPISWPELDEAAKRRILKAFSGVRGLVRFTSLWTRRLAPLAIGMLLGTFVILTPRSFVEVFPGTKLVIQSILYGVLLSLGSSFLAWVNLRLFPDTALRQLCNQRLLRQEDFKGWIQSSFPQ